MGLNPETWLESSDGARAGANARGKPHGDSGMKRAARHWFASPHCQALFN
jgi:hypothetical protein